MSCLDVQRCVCLAARILLDQAPPSTDLQLNQGPSPAEILDQGPPSAKRLDQGPPRADLQLDQGPSFADILLDQRPPPADLRLVLGDAEGGAPLLQVPNRPQRPGVVEGGATGADGAGVEGGRDGHSGGEGEGGGGGGLRRQTGCWRGRCVTLKARVE